MKKKDYELIAGEIKEVRQWIPNSTMADKNRLLAGAELVMFELANEFDKHDFKFDRQKFLTACGIQPDWIMGQFYPTNLDTEHFHDWEVFNNGWKCNGCKDTLDTNEHDTVQD